jgi:UDP-glucose 4-epimerase
MVTFGTSHNHHISLVITGASGFIGQSLISNFSNKKIKIIPVCRHPLPGCHTVRNYFETPTADVLIHLAENSDRQMVNRLGQVYASQVIELANFFASQDYSKIIYVSSGTVYGDGSAVPHGEDENVHPYDVYTKIKLSCEKIFLDVGGLVVRLSNIYGPSMSRLNVISDILQQLRSDGALVVKNDKPIRDFLWIEDASEAITKISLSFGQGIFNVGSGIGTSIRRLCQIILNCCGQGDRKIVSSCLNNVNSINILDISRTMTQFNWYPTIPLQIGINHLVTKLDYFQ